MPDSRCAASGMTAVELVRAGGFEPPLSCFQGRWGRPGSPTPCLGLRFAGNLHRRIVARAVCGAAPPRTEIAMAIMTGLSGNEIYCLGLKGLTPGEIVIGNSVQSIGFVGGIGAGLQSLFGGEVTEVTEAISQGRVESYRRMEHEAQQHDALAITGVTSKLRSMQGNIEFLSVGSCIRRGADGPQLGPFSTSSNGQDLFCL